MNLHRLLAIQYAGRREAVALECGACKVTYGELDRRSARMAAVLRQRGLGAGDRLAVYLPNSLEMVDLFLACARSGIVFTPINILYREREITHIVDDAEPSAIVAAERVSPAAQHWTPAELAAAAEGAPALESPAPLEDDTPLAIIYTSGTTGTSKGAVLTHRNFAANALAIIECWGMTPSDRLLLPLPLFHVHGLGNGLVGGLAAGCRIRLLERFDHRTAAREFLGFRPTLLFAVPTMYVRMLEWPAETARQVGRAARLFVSGSAPLPAAVLEEFHQRFGHVILERYGMTETLMNLSNPLAGERRAGTVGLPMPGVSVRILDEQRQPVPAGQAGEIYVRGPNVFAGYWRNPEATREAFVDGYFRTGDIAVCSPDGYYTLQGRRSDVIISGGFNIYPREIEETLLAGGGVAEVAVVGVPDRARGEVPVAYVVPRGDFDAARLEACCRDQLASFKVPRAFVPVDRLPRTALGKVQKHLLPAWKGPQP